MGMDIARLLGVSHWRAFDVDRDGRVLAGSDESGATQLVEIAPDGSETALTALAGAVSGRYVPGERVVVVQHDTDGDERPQLSLLDVREPRREPAAVDDLRPLARDPGRVHWLLDVLPGRVVYATNRRNGVDFDVAIRSTVTGEEQVVYDRGGMVLEAAASPDSQYLAITVPGQRPLSEQVVLVNTMPATEDEHVVALTPVDEHARHTNVGWLPDDSGLVVTTNSGRDRTGVARLCLRTGEREWLVRPEDLDRDEHDLTGWLCRGGTTLLVQSNEDGASRITLHSAATGELRRHVQLPARGWCCSHPLPPPAWSPDSRFVALSFSAPKVPGDVLLLDLVGDRAWAVTRSAEQLAGEPLVEPAVRRAPTTGGESVPCLVYAPREADPEVAGSAVVVLHGGPEGQSVRAFNPVVQALVARGHAVLVPNVRGSTGYGKRWYSADDGRLRGQVLDDLAAVHDWMSALDLDPARAALWGGSYGGFLVLAALAFQDRWAAGVDIAGMSSLPTFLANTAPHRRAHREREYGSLREDGDFLRDLSPLNRSEAISAPLFVVHGTNDSRVPASEAEQLVTAVRANAVECELRVYDDEGHGLAKRANRLDAYPEAVAFLDRLLAR